MPTEPRETGGQSWGLGRDTAEPGRAENPALSHLVPGWRGTAQPPPLPRQGWCAHPRAPSQLKPPLPTPPKSPPKHWRQKELDGGSTEIGSGFWEMCAKCRKFREQYTAPETLCQVTTLSVYF